MWKFEIVTIKKAKAPLSEREGNWYQYTIANNSTEITGLRRGSKDEVMGFVSASVHRLNNRHKAAPFSKP